MSKRPASASSWINPQFTEGAGAAKLEAALLHGTKLRRKALDACAIGTFLIELPTAGSVTALALAGFDFVVLDMEHSSLDFTSLEPLIIAAQAAGIAVLVRTCGDDVRQIGKVLDMGAHGIMASHVDSPERARAIVEQARFPPTGRRSFSPLMKFDALERPLEALGQSTYVVLQIEGREAVERVGEIAAVPGVDAVFVGPYDLALSLDVPPGSALVRTMAERATRAVPKNIAIGIYVDDPAECGVWAAQRFTLQCVSFDGRMLANGARSIVAEAQRALAKPAKAKRAPRGDA
jgi:2-keto-3-deoxy-L-rhamnonate aldolase RhmA